MRFLVNWRMRSKKLLFCQVWQLLVTCCFRLFLVLFPLFSKLLPLLSSTAENRFFRWGSEERKGCVFSKRWVPRSCLVEGSSELPAKGRKPAPAVVVQRVYPWKVRQESQVCYGGLLRADTKNMGPKQWTKCLSWVLNFGLFSERNLRKRTLNVD